MQFYAMKFHNFCRFGEENNSIVFDILPEDEQLIANGELTVDELYDRIMSNPAKHVERVKEVGITNMIAIAGVLGEEFSKSNGTGKSTIFEGICYLLYEKIVRKTANNDKEGNAGLSVVTKLNGKYPAGMKESFVEGLCEERGKLYRIKRGRTFAGTHKSSTPLLEFESFIGDEADSEASHRTGDTSEAIAQVVNYDYDVFVNSAMFGQSDSGKFLTGTDKIRKEMLINVLRLEDFVSGCLERVRKRKNLKEKEIDKLQTEYSLVQQSIENHVGVDVVKQQIQDAKDLIKTVNKSLATNEKEIDRLSRSDLIGKAKEIKEEGLKVKKEKESKEEQLASQTKEWEALLKKSTDELHTAENTKLPRVQKSITDTKELGKGLVQKIKAFDMDQANETLKKAESAKAQKDKFTEAISKLQQGVEDIISDSGKLRGESSLVTKEVSSLESQIANVDGDEFTCGHCKSKVTRAHIEKEIQINKDKISALDEKLKASDEKKAAYDERLSKGKSKLNTINELLVEESRVKASIQEHESNKVRIKELKAQILKDQDQQKELQAEVEQYKVQKTEYTTKIEGITKKYEDDIADLTKRLGEIREQFTDAQGAAKKIQDQIDALKQQNESKKVEKDTANTKIGSLEKDIQTLEATQKKHKELLKTLETEQKVFERLLRLDGIFGLDGIQTRIVQKYLPLLNAFVKDFLDVLSEGEQGAEIFINNRGKVDLRISGGTASVYELLSGGEKMLIRLAVDIGLALLSFSRCAQKPEIICLDEIFGPLDEFHVARVFELLKKLQTRFNRVMLISHKDEINQHVQHKILVEKTPGNLGRTRIKGII